LREPGEPAAHEWIRSIIDGDVRARVPDIVYLEIANSLLKYVRSGEMTSEEADEELNYVLDMPLERVSAIRLARQALGLAIARGISAYDGAYLALSLGSDAALVTADKRLADEAERSVLLV
jgi:predicted nucleic acid-binding protein